MIIYQNNRLKSLSKNQGAIVDQILIIKLPDGPSAWLRISGVELHKEIKRRALPVLHYPELIFKNFGT